MNPLIGIVGAGPVGLTAALALRRQGVRVRVVEQRLSACRESRAMTLQPRTLEALEPLGVVPELIASGQPVRCVNHYLNGRRCFRLTFDRLPSSYRFMLQIPQYRIEEILAAALRQCGTNVERGAAVTEISQDADRVRTAAGGEREAFDYLVGCDGSRSVVRQALGIGFEAIGYAANFIMGDVDIPDFPLEPTERHTFLAKGTCFLVFPSGDGYFRVVSVRLPGSTQTGDPSFEEFQQLAAYCGAPAMRFENPRWLTQFFPRRAVAERLRDGRIFLAGDAAHIHSPMGAQGMNAGIQDAMNLAWKLAHVCHGLEDERLLDTYEAERLRVAHSLIRNTDRATRRVIPQSRLEQAWQLARWQANRLPALRDRLAIADTQLLVSYRQADAAPVEGFDGSVLPGDRAPFGQLSSRESDGPLPFQLIGLADRSGRMGWVQRFASPWLAPREWADPDGAIRKLYGVKRAGVVLVRPDGHVAALLPAEASSVAQYLARHFSPASESHSIDNRAEVLS